MGLEGGGEERGKEGGRGEGKNGRRRVTREEEGVEAGE